MNVRRYNGILAATCLAAVAACTSDDAFERPAPVGVDVVVANDTGADAGGGDASDDTSTDDVSIADVADGEADAPVSDVADGSSQPDAADVADVSDVDTDADAASGNDDGPRGGRRLDDGRVEVRTLSGGATRVEAWFYDRPGGDVVATLVLQREGDALWYGVTEQPLAANYYGLRAWGPNWLWTDTWVPGSEDGFIADVDAAGHRFNPNKLLLDPWALEMSHDPFTPEWDDWSVYASGAEHRARDSAPVAPTGVILDPLPALAEPRPTRQLADDIIYEVHVRGLTMADPAVPEALRGTYAGAAIRAPYLAQLGVTAVEFLPLHETQNDRNDVEESTAGDNYWGYASLSFFAPDRRYSSDRSAGGPTREFRAMVDAFHAEGIKVFVDVVYNHTGEGGASGDSAMLTSWRGLDNAGFYQTVDGVGYRNDNGVGPNVRFTSPVARRMVVDSLTWWHEELGVDGFRFDLAAILGNECDEDCFRFSADGLLRELAGSMARDADGVGVDLIAEPWGATAGTYSLGQFPDGWHEWNDQYRVTMRGALNRTPSVPNARDIARRLFGSFDVFGERGRTPDASVGYLVSHDGFTWNDLFSCTDKVNDQPWPMGPSDGGSDFNQGNDYDGVRSAQLQAARTAMVLVAGSAGVPMLNGGDEFLRSQNCNNNAYNVDSSANWLNWQQLQERVGYVIFVRRMFELRHAHEALRPTGWYGAGADRDDDGLPAIAWYDIDANDPSEPYWSDPSSPVMVWRLDTDEPIDGRPPVNTTGSRSLAFLWNRSDDMQFIRLPPIAPETRWYRVADTAAWLEADANSHSLDSLPLMVDERYGVHPQSIVVLLER